MSNLLKPRLSHAYPEVVRGAGVYLYDSEDRNYIDGSSGAMTANIGHGVAEIANVMAEQAKNVAFTFRSQFTNRPAEALAAKVASLVPQPLNQVFFVNSGSEASEYAIRLVQQFWRERNEPQRLKVIGREKSYHGMTMGSLSLSGHESRRQDYGALLYPFASVPHAHCYHCAFDKRPDSCALECASAWEQKLLEEGPETVAAIIAEPVVGAAAGSVPAPPGYFKIVREICDRYGIPLILDEVLTGFGRTGKWFAFEHDDIVPDIVLTGKGTSAGYTPMAAVIVTDAIADQFRNGSGQAPFGHTFSGNPLSAATCLAVLDYVERNNLLANAEHMGAQLRLGLEALSQRFNFMVDVRGRGLLLGFEFVTDRARRTSPASGKGVAGRFTDICQAHGLIVYPAGTGTRNNAIIVAPPLTITSEEVDELLARLNIALQTLEQQWDAEFA